MSPLAGVVIGALAGIIVAATGGFVAVRKLRSEITHTEAETRALEASTTETVVDAAVKLLAPYVAQIERQDKEIAAVRAEVLELRAELAESRRHAAHMEELATRLRELPGDDPMSTFVEDGWLLALNTDTAHPLGVHVGLYLDDIDQTVALGYRIVPLEVADAAVLRTPAEVAELRARIEARAAAIREAAGYTPHPGGLARGIARGIDPDTPE